MSFIIDPETGALVSEPIEKARIDARMRLLTFLATRPVLGTYGTNIFDLEARDPVGIAAAPGVFAAALAESPYYEVIRVDLVEDMDVLEPGAIRCTVRLPDGTDLTFTIDAQPDLPLPPDLFALASDGLAVLYRSPEHNNSIISSYQIRYRVVDTLEWTEIQVLV